MTGVDLDDASENTVEDNVISGNDFDGSRCAPSTSDAAAVGPRKVTASVGRAGVCRNRRKRAPSEKSRPVLLLVVRCERVAFDRGDARIRA